MTDALATLTDRMLTAAKRAGAHSADALAVQSTSLSVGVRNGALEDAERAEAIDLGLRVFIGNRTAIVATSQTSDISIVQMAERAVAMAAEAPADPHAGLAEPGQLAERRDAAGLDLCDPAPEPAPDALRDMAQAAEAAALAVPGVTQALGTTAGYSHSALHLAASNGFSGGYSRSSTGLSCGAISGTGTGMERDHDGDSRAFAADLRSPAEIGASAGARAAALQGARQPATGTFDVLFDERISGSLMGHLMQALNGAAVARGASWLRDALGTQIMPSALSLIEDPLRPRTPGSRPFDAEGLACTRRSIVEDGMLTGYTLDLASARKLGLAPTGNAARGVSGAPHPAAGNLTLTQGTHSQADLMRDMGQGLLVTSLIGSTINPNTGDYSRGASGFWIEGGQIAYPVNQITIAGNLRDMLGRIIPANDARLYLPRQVPSLLIEGMTLAGS